MLPEAGSCESESGPTTFLPTTCINHSYKHPVILIHCPLLYYTNDTARKSRVTSLLSGRDLLYVGTGGGAILVLASTTMGLHRLLHAYTKPVRSLLLVLSTKQSPPLFRRLFSCKDSATSSHSMKSDGSDSPRLSRSGHPSLKSYPRSSSFKSSIEESSNPERAVLISLCVGYKRVIGEAQRTTHRISCSRVKEQRIIRN